MIADIEYRPLPHPNLIQMKILRVLLPIFAITMAGSSVVANNLFATIFYRSATVYTTLPPNPIPSCGIQIVPVDCYATTGFVCTIPANEDGQFYIISKKVDGGSCLLARRAVF